MKKTIFLGITVITMILGSVILQMWNDEIPKTPAEAFGLDEEEPE